MRQIKKLIIQFIKTLDLGSAVAVRLTKLTGKSPVPIHPKHLITAKPWFTKYLTRGDLVLDLGTGNGQNAIKAAKIAHKIVAVEISDNLLAIAKTLVELKKIKNIKFETANLEDKLKYKNQTFDKVIFLDVLEHLANRDRALRETNRVLKKHGLMFLGVPNSETSWKKFQRSLGLNSFSDPDHKIEFSESSIRKLIASHGFKIVHFGYGKYDIPARGLVDIIGGLSLNLYMRISDWRGRKAQKNPHEASGFEIVAQKV